MVETKSGIVNLYKEEMISILEEDRIDEKQWVNLINQSCYASFFQTKACYDFLKKFSFLEPFVYAVSENEKLAGLITGYIISDGNTAKKYFSRRAIIFGGVLLGNDISLPALNTLLITTKNSLQNKAIYVEIRNFHDYSDYKSVFEKVGFEYTAHLNFQVSTPDVETTFNQLNTTKRRHVRLSEKAGVQRYATTDKNEIKEFYEILRHLYTIKIKAPLYPIDFFEQLAVLPEGKLFVVKHEGKVIGGSACVELPDKTLYEWFICGIDGAYKNIYPSTMATWMAIEYAAIHGISCFDMMGAGKPNDDYGVREFKSKFGGKLVEYGRFISINNRILYQIGKWGVKLSRLSLSSGKKQEKTDGIYTVENNYDKIDKKDWADFVEKHPNGNVFQTPQMFNLYKDTPKFRPLILVAKNEKGDIVGCLMSVIHREYENFVGEMTTRSIIFGGPLAQNNNRDIIDILLVHYNRLINNKAIYTQFRNLFDLSAFTSVFKKNGYSFESHLDILMDLTKGKDELELQLHKERKRNIAKAEKEGLLFKHLTNNEDIVDVIELLKKTYLRVKVPMSYEQLFIHSKEFLGDHVNFFGAYLNGKMIAGQVRLCYKDMVYAWFAGSDSEFFQKRPNDFLMWNVLLWSKENGYKVFDFGGAGKPGVPYGVRDYKLKYGGELVNHGRFVKTHKPFFMFCGQIIYSIYKKILR